MVSIAARDLRSGRGRLVASVAGVAFSVLLVLFILGTYNGFMDGSTRFVVESGADVWVMEEDSVDVAVSFVPESVGAKVESIAGVAEVTPYFMRFVSAEVNDVKADLFVVGFDADSAMGGPGTILLGTDEVQRQDVVVSRSFFEEHDLRLGDRIRFNERDWKVVGVADVGAISIAGFGYVSADTVRDVFSTGEIVNAYLVRVTPGADPAVVADRIEARTDDVTAFTTDEYAERNSQSLRSVFVPILGAIFVIGFGVSLAVVTITTWSSVNERIGEFGVLKAIGAGNGMLYRLVLAQSATSSFLGFLVGVPIYVGIARLMVSQNARIVMHTVWPQVLGVGVAVLAMAVVASWFPVRRVARIDPADVFRGL